MLVAEDDHGFDRLVDYEAIVAAEVAGDDFLKYLQELGGMNRMVRG